MGKGIGRRALGAGLLGVPALVGRARAGADTVSFGKQYGLPFLPQMVMEAQGLVEKHAAAKGVPGLKVEWRSLSGPGALNEALLSGSMTFINVALPALAVLWDRTLNTPRQVKALCAVQSMPHVLMTRNPAVREIGDFGPSDRIAVPTVKISVQAMMLEIAAALKWGLGAYERLDPLTVSLGHPDALIAMLSGHSEVTGHFCVAPFQYYESAAGMREVLKSYTMLGGMHTNGIQVTTQAFYNENQVLCEAAFDAQEEANAFIRAHPEEAARAYRALSGDTRSDGAELKRFITDPDIDYTTTPAMVLRMTRFMFDVKRIKTMPGRWEDMFLPTAHGLKGS